MKAGDLHERIDAAIKTASSEQLREIQRLNAAGYIADWELDIERYQWTRGKFLELVDEILGPAVVSA